jgi:hypothetical protein
LTREIEKAFQLLDAMPEETKILGAGVSKAEIASAAKLGVTIPTEYAEFMARYGYGGAAGFEIFGLPTGDSAAGFTYPHLVKLNKDLRDTGLGTDILALKVAGNGEVYGLDLSRPDCPPVVVFWPGTSVETADLKVISDSFSEHLLYEVERVRKRLGLD